MPRALIVEILGNAKQFGDELDRAAGKTRSMGKVAGVAGLAIAGGLAYGLEKSVKAAAAAQTSTARMDAAFKQSGASAVRYAGQIGQAEDSSRKLGFSNIDVRQSLGSLEIATHDPAKAFKDLGVAEDIARFKGVSLSDASKTLTMAMAGSQRATKQLGLTIQPVTSTYDALKATMKGTETAQQKQELAAAKAIDKQKTAAEVIALVTEKLHGQAQAYSQTAAGGMAQFRAQMEALQENLGQTLLPALGFLAQKLADVTGWFSQHNDAAKIAVAVLAGLAVTLGLVSVATKIYQTYQTLATAATKLFTIAQEEEDAALVANPIGIVVVALIALGAALYVAWTKSQTFRDIVKGAWRDIQVAVGAVADFLTSTVPNAFDTVRHAAVTAANAIKGVWDGVRGAWAAAWNGIVDAIIGPIKTAIGWVQDLISLIQSIPSIHTPSGGPASSGGTRPGQPRGPRGGRGASGAIVRQPTFALIGEAGPEAVVPLNRMPGASPLGAGGAPTINVTVHGWVGSDQQIAQRLRNELVSLGRREPNIFAGYA